MEIAQLQPEPGREALSYEEQGGGRWYPTLLTMANGDVTAFFGHMKRASTWHLPTELRVYRGKTAPMAKQSGDPNIVCFSPLKLRPFLEISREAGVDHAAVLAIMAAPGLAVGARLRSDAISHARS